MTEQQLSKQLGKGLKLDFNLQASGSTGYFLKSFQVSEPNGISIKENSKCNFEVRERGIVLRANYSNEVTTIPIPFVDLSNITIQRGVEYVNPYFFSRFGILLKLFVPITTARYFAKTPREYSIYEMSLQVSTNNYKMEFIANGYLYEEQLHFFKRLNLGAKFKVEPTAKNSQLKYRNAD